MGNKASKNKPSLQPQDQFQQDFFQGLGQYCGGDQATNQINDKRQSHPDAYNLYPFNSIGRIISVFQQIPTQKIHEFQFGTGVIINKRTILTVAHNIWQRNIKKTADYIFFEPQTQTKQKKLIKVIKYGFHKNYLIPTNKQIRQNYDIAMLVLEQNDIIKPNMFIKLKNGYNFNRQKYSQVLISGYPKERFEQNQQKYLQYSDCKVVQDCKKNFINYQHTTSGGQSGSPLLYKQINQDGNIQYLLIGCHKGKKGIKSYGILITDQKTNELIPIIKNLSISKDNNQHQIQKKLINLQMDIQNLKSNIQAVLQSNNIIWKILNKKAQSLQSLLCPNDPNSFLSSIQMIQQKFKTLFSTTEMQKKSLLIQSVANNLFQKIKKASLNQKQQQKYFQIINKFINVNLGYQQQADQFQFCGQIAQSLYFLLTKLFIKSQHQIKNDRLLTLKLINQKLINKRKQILFKISKGYQNTITQEKRQQKRTQRQLNFYLKLKYFSYAQSYIDTRIQDSQKILFLKGNIMFQSRKLNRAQKFLQIYKAKYIKNKLNPNGDYANTLKNLGQVYRIMNKFDKAFQCFKQNVQIRQKINGKDSLQYADSLNYISTIYIEKRNYTQAIKVIRQSIDIIENKCGQQSIQLIKPLLNIGIAHAYLGEKTKALQYPQRCLKIIQKTERFNYREYIIASNNMGGALRSLKQTKQAFIHYEKCIKLHEDYVGEEDINLATYLQNIGLLYKDIQNYDKCEEYLKRSIKIHKKSGQIIDKIAYAKVLNHLSDLYIRQNRINEGLVLAKQSYQIKRDKVGENHPSTKNSLYNYNECLKLAKQI